MNNRNFRRELLEEYKPIEIKELQSMPKKPSFSILSFLLIPAITITIYIVLFKLVIKSSGNFYLFFVVSAGIGIVTSLIRYFTERNSWKKECEKVKKSNDCYIDSISATSINNGEKFKNGMVSCYPEINSTQFGWIRTYLQKSYLTIRLGKYTGKNPAYLFWKDESLRKQYESEYKAAVDKTKTIVSLPYTLNLKDHKIIGVYGANKEKILNNIIMHIILFHSEDSLRMCIINDKQQFCWCKKISHANSDDGINLYAESSNDIHTVINTLIKLLKDDKKDMNVILLTSDIYLQVRQIRELCKSDQIVFIVLCDDGPTSYCDVVVGDNTVSYSNKVSIDHVELDSLSFETASEFVRNNKIATTQGKKFAEDKKTLPEYIDAFAFFGNPTAVE